MLGYVMSVLFMLGCTRVRELGRVNLV